MNRRTAVRNIVFVSAGAALLPRCTSSDSGSSLQLKHIPLSNSQEKTLAALTATIIPKTSEFIGAEDLQSHVFVATMVDDCASPDDQKTFMDGMKAFDDRCKKKFDKSFVNASIQDRNALLTEIEASKDQNDPSIKFYRTVKNYTIQDFASSKRYLLDVRKWTMVPGPNFKGCVPVKS